MAKRRAATADAPKVDESWRARDDLRTLSSAAEIGQDKRRLAAARAEARRQMTSLEHVAGRTAKKPARSAKQRLAGKTF